MEKCHEKRVSHLKKASEHLNIASSLSCNNEASNDITSPTENIDSKNNRGWKANPLCGTRIKEDHYLYKKECVPPRGGKRKSLFKKKRTKKRKSRKKRRRTKRKRGYGGKSPKRKRGYGGKSPKRRKRK